MAEALAKKGRNFDVDSYYVGTVASFVLEIRVDLLNLAYNINLFSFLIYVQLILLSFFFFKDTTIFYITYFLNEIGGHLSVFLMYFF